MELERLPDADAGDPRTMEELTVGFVLGLSGAQMPAFAKFKLVTSTVPADWPIPPG